MGSSSSKETKNNIHNGNTNPNTHTQFNTATKSDFNLPRYDRNTTSRIERPAVVYNYQHLHSHVNNSSTSKDSCEPFNDLSRSGTSNANSTNLNMQHVNKSHSEMHKDDKYHQSEKYILYNKSASVSKVDKHTADIQSNIENTVLIDKRLSSPKTQTINKKNEPTNVSAAPPLKMLAKDVSAAPPLKMLAKDDFITMWFSWKNDFLAHMRSIDPVGNKEKWGIMLLNRLGPDGQEISRTFIFDDGQAKEDINVLLGKFDQYCTFGNRKIKHDEDIDIYVNNLKIMVSKYTTDVDETVKKKILKEIDMNKFTIIAKSLIPEFSLSSSLKSLSLLEVTYIWMKCENVNFAQREKIDHYTVRNCGKCSLTHDLHRCPAYGKRCNKCDNMNHHWSRCPSQYKNDCSYCGDSHFYRQCPAYMNECSKCHRYNHFYWNCANANQINCKYCGFSHIASKSECRATNIVCGRCYKRGHISSKCRNKQI